MRPGQLSEEGFLLPEQSLLKVIAQDSAYLLEQRISHEQIADRLTTLIARARRFEQIERRRGRSAQSALVDDFSITLESSWALKSVLLELKKVSFAARDAVTLRLPICSQTRASRFLSWRFT